MASLSELYIFFAIFLVSMTLAAPLLLGNNVQAIGVATQNLNNSIGNQQAAVSHSMGVQNNAQQNNSDQSSVKLGSNINALNGLTVAL
jgi:predicted secreted protein